MNFCCLSSPGDQGHTLRPTFKAPHYPSPASPSPPRRPQSHTPASHHQPLYPSPAPAPSPEVILDSSSTLVTTDCPVPRRLPPRYFSPAPPPDRLRLHAAISPAQAASLPSAEGHAPLQGRFPFHPLLRAPLCSSWNIFFLFYTNGILLQKSISFKKSIHISRKTLRHHKKMPEYKIFNVQNSGRKHTGEPRFGRCLVLCHCEGKIKPPEPRMQGLKNVTEATPHMAFNSPVYTGMLP